MPKRDDPFCVCGYRRSLHPDDLPTGSGCKLMLGGFTKSIFFNVQLPGDPEVVDTEMEMA